MNAARQVQKTLLPTAPPKTEGYQFFDFYEAANEVGGDFYDYIVLRDGRVAVVVADVSGKGVAAALVMAKLSAEVRYCLASEPTASKAVDLMNENFCIAGWEGRFATFVLALLDPKTNRVTLVNAGHMPPFIRRADASVSELASEIAGLPFGVTEGITYESAEITLEPGEMVTIFTDGISEALNPANELYTLQRLQKQLGMATEKRDDVGAQFWTMSGTMPPIGHRATTCASWFLVAMLELHTRASGCNSYSNSRTARKRALPLINALVGFVDFFERKCFVHRANAALGTKRKGILRIDGGAAVPPFD